MQLNRWRVVVTLALSVLACDKAGAEPELHIIPQQGLAHPNQAYRVTLEVTWSGGASDYAILPAEMDPIDWGTMTIRAARAFVRDAGNGESQNVVSQTLEFVPNKVGEFTTPAIRVFYLNPGATPPAEKVDHGTAPLTLAPPPRSEQNRSLSWLDPPEQPCSGSPVASGPPSSSLLLAGGLCISCTDASQLFIQADQFRLLRPCSSHCTVHGNIVLTVNSTNTMSSWRVRRSNCRLPASLAALRRR